jgi:hypothetical protein
MPIITEFQDNLPSVDTRVTKQQAHLNDCCTVSTVVDPISVLDVGVVDTTIPKAAC